MEIIRNMLETEYRARQERSQSDYKYFLEPTAAHAFYAMQHRVESSEMAVGHCFHALTLEGKQEFAVEPKADGRTTEGKRIKAAFAAENEGRIILSASEAEKVVGMAEGVRRNKGAMLLLEAATEREVSLFSNGEKCRIDFVFPLGIGDLKSTKGADLWSFSKSILDYGYHIQAAHYLAMAAAAGFLCEDFYIIACENFAPFECAVYKIGHQSLQLGRDELMLLKRKYNHCKETGIYEGYPAEPVSIDIPNWKLRQNQEETF